MSIIGLFLVLFSSSAFATDLDIAGWKEIDGITEQQAVAQARAAIEEELSGLDDRASCGVDEIWGLEREADLIADFPEKRGPIFAIAAYAKGPHPRMGCSSTSVYDCRVVFNKAPGSERWSVEYTECAAEGMSFSR